MGVLPDLEDRGRVPRRPLRMLRSGSCPLRTESPLPSLNEFREPDTAKRRIDDIPQEMLDQLVGARRSGSHTMRDMIDWLTAEGYEISSSQLAGWFHRNGIKCPHPRGGRPKLS